MKLLRLYVDNRGKSQFDLQLNDSLVIKPYSKIGLVNASVDFSQLNFEITEDNNSFRLNVGGLSSTNLPFELIDDEKITIQSGTYTGKQLIDLIQNKLNDLNLMSDSELDDIGGSLPAQWKLQEVNRKLNISYSYKSAVQLQGDPTYVSSTPAASVTVTYNDDDPQYRPEHIYYNIAQAAGTADDYTCRVSMKTPISKGTGVYEFKDFDIDSKYLFGISTIDIGQASATGDESVFIAGLRINTDNTVDFIVNGTVSQADILSGMDAITVSSKYRFIQNLGTLTVYYSHSGLEADFATTVNTIFSSEGNGIKNNNNYMSLSFGENAAAGSKGRLGFFSKDAFITTNADGHLVEVDIDEESKIIKKYGANGNLLVSGSIITTSIDLQNLSDALGFTGQTLTSTKETYKFIANRDFISWLNQIPSLLVTLDNLTQMQSYEFKDSNGKRVNVVAVIPSTSIDGNSLKYSPESYKLDIGNPTEMSIRSLQGRILNAIDSAPLNIYEMNLVFGIYGPDE